MPKAIILGAGMVGSVMAADLAADPAFSVTVADASARSLDAAAARAGLARARITPLRADLSDGAAVRAAVAPFDIVLGALPSAIGFGALRAVIEAGKNCCDISFMSEDPLALDSLARARGVTAVVDCGVAPGMSNMLAGYEASRLEQCDRIEIYVGGLPRERRWPFQYKAAFAPSDVLEEYTRPVRIVEHGQTVERDALTEPELLDFPGVGTLEAVLTDGLRSLATTMQVPFMKEKTLRYPGHYELMRVMRATGLFSKTPVKVGGASVRPIDLTSALMFPMWTYEPGEEDLTIMRVIVEGVAKGTGAERVRITRDLFDTYDRATGATSMARTTGFPCTAVARLIASGRVRSPGVNPPEVLGRQAGILDSVLASLADKGIRYTAATTPCQGKPQVE